MRRALAAAVAAMLVLPALAGAAWGAFSAGATATQSVGAASLPAGPKPTAAVTGSTVTLTFPVSLLSDGVRQASSYDVERAGTSSRSFSCPPPGSGTTVTCADSGVASGSYSYTTRPVYASWRGAASEATTVAVGTFSPTQLAFHNAATLRTLEAGDRITVTYDATPARTSVCPGWSGTTFATTLTVRDGGGQASDVVTVGNCDGFGRIELGGNDWLNGGDATAAIVVSADGASLTITLGASPSRTVAAGSTTATYRPGSGLVATDGRAVSGTVSATVAF